MKVLINRCFGGFSVSKKVYEELGIEIKDNFYGFLFELNLSENKLRTYPPLIEVVEKIGLEESSGSCAELDIIEIPDDIDWYISDYDGIEEIHETHRTWI